jgi:hypothetical protein
MAPGLASETSVNTVGLLFTLLMCLMLLVAPRRFALLPVVVLVCYMSMGQRVVVGGLNFTMIRILLCCGWLRVMVRGEWTRIRFNAVDKLVIVWTVVRTINYALVWGSTTALTNRAGYAYNILGAYFLFRMLVRDADDVRRWLRYLAICIGPLAVLILMEKTTAHNPFAVFGGVPPVSEIRDGVLRCQGPFSHSILAGTFGATCVPLFVGLWLRDRRSAGLTLMGVLASMIIIAMGGSSGPVLAFGFGLIGLALWPLRSWMRAIRWTIVTVLAILHLAMNAPVWFVIARLSVFSGSTGWFRGFLIDMTVSHFSEWWLIGSNRAPMWHPFLLDVTNQYVAEGLDGGLLSIVLFIAILGYSFRSVGKVAHNRGVDRRLRLFAWSLGAALIGHAASFISVTYFDQNAIAFYLLLASIAVAGVASAGGPAVAETAPAHAAAPLSPWQDPGVFGGERYA